MENNAGSLLFGLWAEDMHLRTDGFLGSQSGMRVGDGRGGEGGGLPCRQRVGMGGGGSFSEWGGQAGEKGG